MAVIVCLSVVIIGALCRLLCLSRKTEERLSDCISDLENQIHEQGKRHILTQGTVSAKTDRIEELVEILDRMQDERASVVRWLRDIPESLHRSSRYRETGTGCDEDDSLSSQDQKCTM